jgi:hypothetical protein
MAMCGTKCPSGYTPRIVGVFTALEARVQEQFKEIQKSHVPGPKLKIAVHVNYGRLKVTQRWVKSGTAGPKMIVP